MRGEKKQSISTRDILKRGPRVVLLVLVATFYGLPLYWTISTALKPLEDIVASPVPLLPPNPGVMNFVSAFVTHRAFESILDSLIVASVVTAISLVISFLAAYSIARYRTGGRNFSFWILSNRMLPAIVFVIPFFLLFKFLGLIDTYSGIILPYLTFEIPFAVWILISFFKKIPREIDEMAMIDGASFLTILFRIILPLSLPGIAAITVLLFVFSWNEFLYALLLTRGAVRTLPILIPQLYGGSDMLYGEVSAVTLCGVIPAIVLVIFFQRYLVRGLSFGAIKE